MKISALIPDLRVLPGSEEGSRVTGANLGSGYYLTTFANHPEVECLEIFLPPSVLGQTDRLANIARETLRPENRGKGKLAFYSVMSLPEVFADGSDRVIHTEDLHTMSRDRDIRDRYATGPTVIASDTHCNCHRVNTMSLERIAGLPPANFDLIYSISRALTVSIRQTMAHFGAPDAAWVETLPRATYLGDLQPATPAERAIARERLGLPADRVLGLFLGRLSPVNKADLLPLLEEYAAHAQTYGDLVIAGPDDALGYREILRQVCRELGVSHRVHFLSELGREGVLDAYRAADFFVFPGDAVNEAFGQTALESAAAGLPCVISDWNGMKDIVVEGETALLVPTSLLPVPSRYEGLSWLLNEGDSHLALGQILVVHREILREQLIRMFRDADLRSRMGAAARRRFDAEFNPTGIWSRRFDLMREQLARARAESPSEQQRRRQAGQDHPLTIPLRAQLAAYPTDSLGDHILCEPTLKGEAIVNGGKTWHVTMDARLMAHPAYVQALWDNLRAHAPVGFETWVQKTAKSSGFNQDVLAISAAIMLKQGLVGQRLPTNSNVNSVE